MKSCLQGNDIKMHSVHNEEEPIVAGRFTRTLRNQIYKYMTSTWKNIDIDKQAVIKNTIIHTITQSKRGLSV